MLGRREIKQLQVRCANTGQWTGTVGTLNDHMCCPNLGQIVTDRIKAPNFVQMLGYVK